LGRWGLAGEARDSDGDRARGGVVG